MGFGKTMVARGVIAKAIHHALAKDPSRRFDVVYICSNSAIARQNINSLNVTGTKNFPLPIESRCCRATSRNYKRIASILSPSRRGRHSTLSLEGEI